MDQTTKAQIEEWIAKSNEQVANWIIANPALASPNKRNYDHVRELVGITEGHITKPENVDKLVDFIERFYDAAHKVVDEDDRMKLALVMPELKGLLAD